MPEQLEFPWDMPEDKRRKGAPAKEPVRPPRVHRPATSHGHAEFRATDATYTAAHALHKELSQRTGMRLRLRITNNSSTIMSLRHAQAGEPARLSLHHMFLEAPPEVRKALAAWILHPRAKKSGGVIDQFIRQHRDCIQPSKPRPTTVRTKGRYFDLARIFDDLNQTHFRGAIHCAITWGNMPTTRRRRSIRFGSHSQQRNLIRIHPLLDQDFVPAYFVRYIVFHEMLHAYLGVGETPSGRRSIHPPEFKRLEETWPGYKRAIAWLEQPGNLRRLLRTPHA